MIVPKHYENLHMLHENTMPSRAYIRHFTYEREECALRACLNFEGVDSCFYVWLNGSWATARY